MYNIRCDKCGFEDVIDYSISAQSRCPNCDNPLIVELENEDDDIPIIIDEHNLQNIKNEIKKYGNKKVWKDIENIEIPYVRAEFRKLFFEVGGVMPKGKGIKI